MSLDRKIRREQEDNSFLLKVVGKEEKIEEGEIRRYLLVKPITRLGFSEDIQRLPVPEKYYVAFEIGEKIIATTYIQELMKTQNHASF